MYSEIWGVGLVLVWWRPCWMVTSGQSCELLVKTGVCCNNVHTLPNYDWQWQEIISSSSGANATEFLKILWRNFRDFSNLRNHTIVCHPSPKCLKTRIWLLWSPPLATIKSPPWVCTVVLTCLFCKLNLVLYCFVFVFVLFCIMLFSCFSSVRTFEIIEYLVRFLITIDFVHRYLHVLRAISYKIRKKWDWHILCEMSHLRQS